MKSSSSILLGLFFLLKILGSHCFLHPVSVSSSASVSSASISSPRVAFSSSKIERVVSTTTTTTTPTTTTTTNNGNGSTSTTSLGALRGGGAVSLPFVENISKVITSLGLMKILTSLTTGGQYGVPALAAIASAVVIPLTLYRQGYSFSVGYGSSVFMMGLAMWSMFGPNLVSAARLGSPGPLLLLASVLFYGFRMALFLLVREYTVKSKHEQMKAFDKTPLLKRIPLAISVSIFYAFEVTPVLYVCRSVLATTTTKISDAGNIITMTGAAIAWIGALVEALADTQKYLAKRGKDDNNDNDNDKSTTTPEFHGPTTGLYSASRHPNYLGELIFWFGILVGGAPSFGKSPIAWVCSSLGFFGIWNVMMGATNGLDAKQKKKYGGQDLYDKWRSRTSKLMPSEIVDSMLFGPYNLKNPKLV